MLALLRCGLILALAAVSASAAEEDEVKTASGAWGFGVGYAPEYFHWHETSARTWYALTQNWRGVTTVNEDSTCSTVKRFVTESGARHRFHADLEYHVNRQLAFDAEATLLLAAVDYDGGLQSGISLDSAIRAGKADTITRDGTSYVAKSLTPWSSTTGYRGFQLDGGASYRTALGHGFLYDGRMGLSYRSTRRLVAYTESRTYGYDEVWNLSWAEFTAGASRWISRSSRAGLQWTLLIPFSASETIESINGGAYLASSSIGLRPVSNGGWRLAAFWENEHGLRVNLS